MLRQDQLQTLKQTHRTATTVMPLVTAGLALMSAMIAALGACGDFIRGASAARATGPAACRSGDNAQDADADRESNGEPGREARYAAK